MYEAFFSLKRKAFSLTSDPGVLFLNNGSREVLAGITYAILERKGLMVLTGEAGTGKSTLLARVLRFLPAPKVQISSVMSPTLTTSEFLEMVLVDFGVGDIPESKTQRLLRLRELLAKNHEQGKTSVLVVDEAHKLSAKVLEEIRLLGNFESPEQKFLQVLLAGQPELSDVLNREDMRQFKQRIAIRLRIEPLAESEVHLYIQSRWKEAGGREPLPFRPEALALIAKCSKGIPRLINSLCDNALLLAFAEGSMHVTDQNVQSAAEDLELARPAALQLPVRIGSPSENSERPPEPLISPVADIAPFRDLASNNGSGVKSWWIRWTGRLGLHSAEG